MLFVPQLYPWDAKDYFYIWIYLFIEGKRGGGGGDEEEEKGGSKEEREEEGKERSESKVGREEGRLA